MRAAFVLVLSAVIGCGPARLANEGGVGDEVGTQGDTDGPTSGESDSSSESDSDGTDTSSDTDSGGTDTDTGVVTTCGDGVVEPGESCDDGNQVDGDSCPADCQVPIRACDGKFFQCGDGIDNDEDGLVDLYDPECFSPCDDDEGSFDTDKPGVSNTCKLDCAWDDNLLGGDDHCESDLRCYESNLGEPFGCDYDPLFAEGPWCTTPQPEDCLSQCGPLTPNGCDCLGCCEVDGALLFFARYTQCGDDDLGACGSCVQEPACLNPCESEACELCFLEGPDALAEGCEAPSCPAGVEPCVDPYACPEDRVCQGGCCLPFRIE